MDVQSAISDIRRAHDSYSSFIDHPHPLDPAIATHYEALANADAAEVERVLSEAVRRSDNPDQLMKRLLRGAQQTRAFSSSAFLRACARATQMFDDRKDWLFPRFFLSRSIGGTDNETSDLVGVLLNKALDEIRSAPAERRADGLVRMLECVPKAFLSKAQVRQIARKIGRTASVLASVAEGIARADETTRRADLARIWRALRDGANELFTDLVPKLDVLCGTSGSATRDLLELVLAEPPAQAKSQLKPLRFRLHQLLGEADEMAATIHDINSSFVTATAYEAAGRIDDAIAILKKLPRGPTRDNELARLASAVGGTSAALEHVQIDPDNAGDVAKKYGVGIVDVIRLGCERDRDKTGWIKLALQRNDYELATSIADGPFQPTALGDLLAAGASAPVAVLRSIATRAVEQVLAPSTIWLDDDAAKSTVASVTRTALALAGSDKEREKLRASLQKKAERAIAKTDSYLVRELAFELTDVLAK